MIDRQTRTRNGDRSSVIGVDLGATKVVSAVVDRQGRVTGHSGVRNHRNDGYGPLLEAICESIDTSRSAEKGEITAVGIGIAAQVDSRSGRVLYAPNLGWKGRSLTRDLSRRLGLSVYVINDARAATLAEWRYGAGRGSTNWLCIMMGTGVGSSAVVGGALLDGSSNAFGEIGHLTLVSGGRKCHCPHRGCVEAYVGGWAIAERAREAARNSPPEGRAMVALAGSVRWITARTVFEAFRARDRLATRLVRETEQYLSDAIVGIVNGFNPSRIVLGGGIVEGIPHLLPILRESVRSYCQPSESRVRVVPATLGPDVVLIGAAEFAKERASKGANPPSVDSR